MIERNFSSAHQLRGYKGKCENLHGHNYKIEIYARGSELNNIGLLVDFVELKEAADDLVTYLDHRTSTSWSRSSKNRTLRLRTSRDLFWSGWRQGSMTSGCRFTKCDALKRRPAWRLTRSISNDPQITQITQIRKE